MVKKNEASVPAGVSHEERGDDSRSGIQVIRRAVGVLRVLAEQGHNGLSLGAIAARVELPRSTVQRIVGALEDEGMVAPAPAGGGFYLGPTMGVLARGLDTDPVEVFRGEMSRLLAELDESVVLTTLADGRVLVLETLSSPRPLRVVLPKVLEVDLFTSAPGKAMLAILADTAREAQIAAADGDVDRAAFDAELAQARNDGYAIEEDQPFEGISALAIAVELGGKPYSIVVTLPTARFPAERAAIAAALLDSARVLARRITGASA
jgi:DNA-binding IclR family transcriptional regulator